MKELKHCPYDFDEEMNRKYFKLAGGRIELHTTGNGSTPRFVTNEKSHPLCMLLEDKFIERYAHQLHMDIEDYVAAETARLKAENERLREALEFYAGTHPDAQGHGSILSDAGSRARKALEETE